MTDDSRITPVNPDPGEGKPHIDEGEARKLWQAESRDITLETLPAFLRHLAEDYHHTYGTICVAIGAAAVAAARAMDHSPQGGITGFQAGAVFWEFHNGWGAVGRPDAPHALVDYSNMLYPQYADKFEKVISPRTWDWLKGEAAKNLAENPQAHPDVIAHWQRTAAGEVPFGYAVRET